MNIYLSIFFFIILNTSLFSQTEVGNRFDLSGEPFDNIFNPFLYNQDNSIIAAYVKPSFEKGYYYNELGKRINGYILFNKNIVHFKQNLEDKKKLKLKPTIIKSLIIGVDSFFSATNFSYRNLKKSDSFVRFITNINGFDYAVYTTSNGTNEEYIFKRKKDEEWENFYGGKNKFIEKSLKHFGNIPHLKKNIINKNYRYDDTYTLIKTAQYHNHFLQKKQILFDAYWKESYNISRKKYVAKIEDQKDSTWTVSYFENSKKLFTANLSSFYPNNKNGEFIIYKKDGSIAKKMIYNNDTLKTVSTYNTKEIKEKSYNVKITKKLMSRSKSFVYNEINGKKIHNDTLTSIDPLNGRKYKQTYIEGILKNSTFLKGETLIHQFTDPSKKIKLDGIQNRMDIFLKKQNYKTAISEDAQGTVLVAFIINKGGYIIDYKILNKLHPQIDSLMVKFVKEMGPKALRRYKFFPNKVENEFVNFEVVIPFEFVNSRSYRNPFKYYFLLSPLMMNRYHYIYSPIMGPGGMMMIQPVGI
ncbi:MAG: hypothetical protein ACPGSO_07600 [Vicingaceae bacterium]